MFRFRTGTKAGCLLLFAICSFLSCLSPVMGADLSRIQRETSTIPIQFEGMDGRIEYEEVDFSDGDIREDIFTLCPLHTPMFTYKIGSNAFKLHIDRPIDSLEKKVETGPRSFMQTACAARTRMLVEQLKEGEYDSLIDGLGAGAHMVSVRRAVKRNRKSSFEWQMDSVLPACSRKPDGRPKFFVWITGDQALSKQTISHVIETAREHKEKALFIRKKFPIWGFHNVHATPEKYETIIKYCENEYPDFPVLWLFDHGNQRKPARPWRRYSEKKMAEYLRVLDGTCRWFGSDPHILEYTQDLFRGMKSRFPDKAFGLHILAEYWRSNSGAHTTPAIETFQLRDNLETGFELFQDGTIDFINFITWNDFSENHQIMPTVNHGFARLDILKYYTKVFRGERDFKFARRKIIVSYQPELLLGQTTRIEVLSLPSRARDVDAELTLEDINGEVLYRFPKRRIGFDELEVNRYMVSTVEFKDTDIIVPKLTLYRAGSSEVEKERYLKFIKISKNACYSDLAVQHISFDRLAAPKIEETFSGEGGTFSFSIDPEGESDVRSVELMYGSDKVLYNFTEADDGGEASFEKNGIPIWIEILGDKEGDRITIRSHGGEILDAEQMHTYAEFDRRLGPCEVVYNMGYRSGRKWGDKVAPDGGRFVISGGVDASVELDFSSIDGENDVRFKLREVIQAGGIGVFYCPSKRQPFHEWIVRVRMPVNNITCRNLLGEDSFASEFALSDEYPVRRGYEPYWLRVVFEDDCIFFSRPHVRGNDLVERAPARETIIYNEREREWESVEVNSYLALNEDYEVGNKVNWSILPGKESVPRLTYEGIGIRSDILYLGGVPSQAGTRVNNYLRAPEIVKGNGGGCLKFTDPSIASWVMGTTPHGPHKMRLKVRVDQLPDETMDPNVNWGELKNKGKKLLYIVGFDKRNSFSIDSAGRLYFGRVDYGRSKEKLAITTTVSGGKLKKGKWYTIGYNYYVTSVELVVDGEVVGRADTPLPLKNHFINSQRSVSLGNVNPDRRFPCFDGAIKWVRMWNLAEEK